MQCFFLGPHVRGVPDCSATYQLFTNAEGCSQVRVWVFSYFVLGMLQYSPFCIKHTGKYLIIQILPPKWMPKTGSWIIYVFFKNNIAILFIMCRIYLHNISRMILMNIPCAIISEALLLLIGIIIFAYFSTCDPLSFPDSEQKITSPNQVESIIICFIICSYSTCDNSYSYGRIESYDKLCGKY